MRIRDPASSTSREKGPGHLAQPSGRKPPLMAEVGQAIFHERIIGIVPFTYAKELRGAAGL
jgi:hypothetical protein